MVCCMARGDPGCHPHSGHPPLVLPTFRPRVVLSSPLLDTCFFGKLAVPQHGGAEWWPLVVHRPAFLITASARRPPAPPSSLL